MRGFLDLALDTGWKTLGEIPAVPAFPMWTFRKQGLLREDEIPPGCALDDVTRSRPDTQRGSSFADFIARSGDDSNSTRWFYRHLTKICVHSRLKLVGLPGCALTQEIRQAAARGCIFRLPETPGLISA